MIPIERFYPLTPMQKGMLFHSLLHPTSGVYFEQFIYNVNGPIDLNIFQVAWTKVTKRNAILRTSLFWDTIKEPIQLIHADFSTPIQMVDLSHAGSKEQLRLLEDIYSFDRRNGFDLIHKPPIRGVLIKLNNTTWQFVLSYHHLILDAWSLFILLKEMMLFYDNVQLTDIPPSFFDYVIYLRLTDNDGAIRFWSDYLSNFEGRSLLGSRQSFGRIENDWTDHIEAKLTLSTEETDQLTLLGRELCVTINTIVQAAWSLVLSLHTNRTDVVYGITISHRPPDLLDVESIVGIFINTLPIRVTTERSLIICKWLQSIQQRQLEVRNYDYYPLVDIQRLVQVPQGDSLFDTLLIFENFPKGDMYRTRNGVELSQNSYIGWTNYPLAIEAMPGSPMYFQVKYDRQLFSSDVINRLLEDFRAALNQVSRNPHLPISEMDMMKKPFCPVLSSSGMPVCAEELTVGSDDHFIYVVRKAWADVLKMEAPDIEIPFFDLGGNSLLLLEVQAKLRSMNIHIPLIMHIKYPTITSLAAKISEFNAGLTHV